MCSEDMIIVALPAFIAHGYLSLNQRGSLMPTTLFSVTLIIYSGQNIELILLTLSYRFYKTTHYK